MASVDETLYETMLRIENKDIFVDIKKNKSGIYLKISERNGHVRNTVLIPASGISKLKSVIDDITNSLDQLRDVSRERKDRVSGDPDIVTRSVYVTGLTWETNEDELVQYFSQAGNMASSTDHESSRFVVDLHAAMIIPPFAQSPPWTLHHRCIHRFIPTYIPPPFTTLPFPPTPGTVLNAAVLRQRRKGPNKASMGCAVVEFATREMALHAVNILNETILNVRLILVLVSSYRRIVVSYE